LEEAAGDREQRAGRGDHELGASWEHEMLNAVEEVAWLAELFEEIGDDDDVEALAHELAMSADVIGVRHVQCVDGGVVGVELDAGVVDVDVPELAGGFEEALVELAAGLEASAGLGVVGEGDAKDFLVATVVEEEVARARE
jgi:hypothetical protein